MKLKMILEEFKKGNLTFYELSPDKSDSDGLAYIREKLDEDTVRFISNGLTKKVIVFNADILHTRATEKLRIPYSFKVWRRDYNYFFGVGDIQGSKITNVKDIELENYIEDLEEGFLKKEEKEEELKRLYEIRKKLDKHPSIIDLSKMKTKIDRLLD